MALENRVRRAILDADLAAIYGAQTKRRSEQVLRKSDRFPPDFLIQLTLGEAKEIESLRSQFATLKRGREDRRGLLISSSSVDIRSQFVTSSRKRNIHHLPYAFTEHGAIMAATP